MEVEGLAERAPRSGQHVVRGVVSARSCQSGCCPVRFPMTIKTAFLEERVLLVLRGRRGCRPGDFFVCLLSDDSEGFYIRMVSPWADGFKTGCATFRSHESVIFIQNYCTSLRSFSQYTSSLVYRMIDACTGPARPPFPHKRESPSNRIPQWLIRAHLHRRTQPPGLLPARTLDWRQAQIWTARPTANLQNGS